MTAERASRTRRVFSVNVPDAGLARFMEDMSAKHSHGTSGWIRDLVTAARTEWDRQAGLRTQALAKLTDAEKAALGYPTHKDI